MTDKQTPNKPLRLWPGVSAVVLQWLLWFVVPLVLPGTPTISALGGLATGLVFLLWWTFFSRAPRLERWGGLVLMISTLIVMRLFTHDSIRFGMMGTMFVFYTLPIMTFTLVSWAMASRGMTAISRRVSMVAAILLATAPLMLARTTGVNGDAQSDLHWRWTQTSEERFLAQTSNEPMTLPPAATEAKPPESAPRPRSEVRLSTPAVPAPSSAPDERVSANTSPKPESAPAAAIAPTVEAEWPGFRGPLRDDIVRGVRIGTDWSTSPPVAIWRRPIGPGWSSFAVAGDLFYTQEQRGGDEVVTCYKVSTGQPVWVHRDVARFWESNAGAGPRGTPTFSKGRLYTFGATGLLNALNAANGAVVWKRNAAADTGVTTPIWGFASSPLVFGDTVIVAAAGALIAYDIATGEPRWRGPASSSGYSSPHLATIDGVDQILQVNAAGAISVAADGKLLWQHKWPGDGIVQPAVSTSGDVFIGSGSGMGSGVSTGLQRIAITHSQGAWSAAVRWTSLGLKPYYNDFVLHKGHAFGFDGGILSCINLDDGKRVWKGGRYGYGQFVLLPDQDVLIVLSEEGELALVKATPDQFTELARVPAIEGKTWNHPVLAGSVLLVRNGQEMAAFRLSLEVR